MVTVTACSGDDDGGDDEAVEETTPVAVVDTLVIPPEAVEEPIGSVEVFDTGFVPEVLADDEVTPEELTEAYTRYIDCLADGGGYGRYAYDLDLHAGLTLDWQVPGDASGRQANTLSAGCSDAYLGQIANRYFATAERPDDLQARQRDSIAACVAAIDPGAAERVPDDITTDTSVDGVYIGEAQAALEFLEIDEADATEVSLCFARVGVPWQEFGTAPDPDDEADGTADAADAADAADTADTDSDDDVSSPPST